MIKKLLKKTLTAVLSAALLLTNGGVASLSVSAAEKIYVEGVYVNFHKATMAIGTSRQIKAYVEPADATVQRLRYKSSAPEVASVSSTGLITAISPGKAVITVLAADGSYESETIEITVLEDLFITKDMVDADNEVIVLDKIYGNVTVDSSVGDADIYLSGITVRNILALDSGNYSVYLFDCSIKELKIDDVWGEIESFVADGNENIPMLTVGENTKVNSLNVNISAGIRQLDGSAIDGLRIVQNEDGKIKVYLENYTGGIILDASVGDLEIVTIGCSLSEVVVNGSEDAGNITLTDGGNSEISNLVIEGSASVVLGIHAAEVKIEKNAAGASLTVNESIGTLKNFGSGSDITIAGSVDNIEANGADGKFNVTTGGYVGTINLNGAGNTLTGSGEVSEAYVNADNCSIDTVNTLVTIGDVDGTKIQGNAVAGGTTVATKPPVSETRPIPEPVKPKQEKLLIKVDFEDGQNPFVSHVSGVASGVSHNGGTFDVVTDHGYNSTHSLLVRASKNWEGIGYKFDNTKSKTYRVTARLKNADTSSGNFAQIYNYNTNTVISTFEINKSSWTLLDVTFTIGPGEAVMITPSWQKPDSIADVFYVDDFTVYEVITEDETQEPGEPQQPEDPAAKVVIDFENVAAGTTYKMMGWNPTDGSASVVQLTESNKALEVKPTNYNNAAVISITLPEGKKLGDYGAIKFKVYWKSGDVGWKTIYVEAGETLSGPFGNKAEQAIGSKYRAAGTTTGFEVETIDLNGNKSDLSGTFEIAIGINCKKEENGEQTVYYLDDIELVPKSVPEILIDFNSEPLGKAYKLIAWNPSANSAVVTAVSGSAIQALEVRPVDYNTAAVIPVDIPAGYTLADYKAISFKAYWKSGDVGWKNVIIEAAKELSGQFGNKAERVIGSKNRSAGAGTDFEEMTIDLSGDNSQLSGRIEIAIGINCAGSKDGEQTVYYLDDIKFIPKDN